MVSVKEVLVVEGRYDKNTLSQIVDATIVCTDGFSIFRAPERRRCSAASRSAGGSSS